MKIKQFIILPILAVLVAAFAFGCKRETTQQTQTLQPLSVRLTWLHQSQFAGLYLALDKGFYKDAGLDVQLKQGGLEFPSIKMVVLGDDDIGMTSADQILLARSKGSPVVAVAAMYQKCPAVLVTLKKSGIVTAEDLRGKTIGLKYGDDSEIPVRAMFRKLGIDKDIKIVSVSYDPSPLIQGQVDAFADWAINVPISLENKGYQVNLINPSDYGINMYADVIFTTESVLAKKRPAIIAFLKATLKGYQYAIDHPDEAVAATLKMDNNLKLEDQKRMFEASIPLWKPNGKPLGEMQPNDWDVLNDILLTTGLIKEKVPLDKMVNYDLLKEAGK